MSKINHFRIDGVTYDIGGSGEGGSYDDTELRQLIAGKQNQLTAGANITIVGDVISATGGGESYIPQRGVDYWTAADIATIKSYVDDAILGGAW